MKANKVYQNYTRPGFGQIIMLALTIALGVTLLVSIIIWNRNSEKYSARGETWIPEPEGVTLAPPVDGELRIAVASDLHLDPDNTDRSGDVTAVSYNPELVDALLWDMRQKGAEIVLLTGDLVNGGKSHRHEALAEKLYAAEADGLRIYVLPGNHDLAPIGQKDFASYYADFGYNEAFSRDRTSLSYSILLDDLMLLMLDTGGYRAGAIDLPNAPKRENNEAFLSEFTLRWIEEQLKEAQIRRIHVLCAGHYNLLTEYSRIPESGYYLENGDRLAKLLRQYHVPLYLSGHMHVQAVYQENGLTELLTEYLLSYPTGYSILDLMEHTLRFTPVRVDVNAWAAAANQHDPVLLRFSEWQMDTLRASCKTAVESMAERNTLRKDEVEKASDFFYAVMLAYWEGTLSEKRDTLETMPGRQPFFRSADGYSYGWWLQDMMDFASPMMRGFALEWG